MNFVLELFCIVIVIGWYCWNCGGTRREGSKRASSTVKVVEDLDADSTKTIAFVTAH